jgi:hypothetical protein
LGHTNFLKRTWRYEPILNRLVAPLELSVILHMNDYSHKGEYYLSGSRDTCDVQLKELSLHGKEVYEKYVPTILQWASEKLEYTPRLVDFYTNLMVTSVSNDHY